MTSTNESNSIDLLLFRIQSKNEGALKALYDQCASRLLGIISRIVHDFDEAEDVLQEVFVKVWNQASQYRGSGTAWGWLCVLTRNSALDRIRSLTARPHISIEDQESSLEKLFSDDRLSESETLECCLNLLKQQTRKSILLSYVHGYSHRELAEKFAAPLGTVKAWVRRGLQELKLCLTQ